MTRLRARPLLALLAIALLLTIPALAVAKQPAGIGSTAPARVFLPNPVATLQNESLTDQKDADYAALQPAYRWVTLTDLDGTGFLCGRWACVTSETGAPAYEPDGTFDYNRHDDRFEQVMAYYWVTAAQKYIQSLGFGSTYPGSTRTPRRSASTSGVSTTASPPIIRRTRCGSARAASTMRRTPR